MCLGAVNFKNLEEMQNHWIKKNIKRKSVKKLKDILEQNLRKTKIHRWQHEVSSSNEISKWSYFALF